jgi:hypothetical protein
MTICRVPWCVALADPDPDQRIRDVYTGGVCRTHRQLADADLKEALRSSLGLIEPLECVGAGRIEYETSDGRRYMRNTDGSIRWLAQTGEKPEGE